MSKVGDQIKFASFKQVPGGYVFRAPNRKVFGRSDHYLVDEAQRDKIVAIMTPSRPRLLLAAWIGGYFLAVAAAIIALSTFARHLPVTVFVVLIAAMLSAAILGLHLAASRNLRRLQPILAGAQPTDQRITTGWRGSVEPTMADLVMPLWQIAARGKDGGTPRSRAMPDLPTFEEFFESVHHKKPSGFLYEVLRASSDPLVAMFRTALLPPNSPAEITGVMRSAFVTLAQDKDFIRDYASAVKTDPLVVPGADAQEIVAALGKVKPEIKAFVIDYTSKLVK